MASIPFPSIKTQLLIISLVVLVLPWIGLQTIRDIENLLREQQVHSIKTSATSIIEGLEPITPLVKTHNNKLRKTELYSEISLAYLQTPLIIDGYTDDWPEDRLRQRFGVDNALKAGNKDSQISFELSTYHRANSLILLLDVTDDKLYQTSNSALHPRDGDHILLSIGNNPSNMTKYILTSNSPGWLSVIPADRPRLPETRIQAEMQIRGGGYTIEIEIPYFLAGDHLSIHVIDRDDSDPLNTATVGNSTESGAGLLFTMSPAIREKLASYRTQNQKLTLLDFRGNILATDGLSHTDISNIRKNQSDLIGRVHQLLLLADALTDSKEIASFRMEEAYIQNALNNQADYVYTRNEQRSGLLSIAIPFHIDNQVSGALVVQQSTEAIDTVRQRALIKIILTSLSAMIVVILILLIYATVLIRRISKLNKKIQLATNKDGRVNDKLQASIINDEIGELDRGMIDMMGRLHAYQQYLETMASKLSHEMRTPLTVVQSSLENLQNESSELADNQLITRANDGLNRLKTILNNLTEASRLENALKTTELKIFNLPAVIESCVLGYQQAYRDVSIKYSSNIENFELLGSADLIAQLLDKLISNAIDFHTPGSTIEIAIHKHEAGCELIVHNTGQPVPDSSLNTLFDSMISARSTTSETPHLGLGLYIVRLIATFHHGVADIANENDGVSIRVFFNEISNLSKKRF